MQQFYDAIDVSKTGFYAMEENNTLNMKTLERISETLDVPLSYWFSTEDASTSPVFRLTHFMENVKGDPWVIRGMASKVSPTLYPVPAVMTL